MPGRVCQACNLRIAEVPLTGLGDRRLASGDDDSIEELTS